MPLGYSSRQIYFADRPQKSGFSEGEPAIYKKNNNLGFQRGTRFGLYLVIYNQNKLQQRIKRLTVF